MSAVKVAFLGTPEFAKYHLQYLLDDSQYEVVGVVTQPDRKQGRKLKLTPSPVKELALVNNIPVISPEKFNNESTYETVNSWKAEAIVVVAYGQIISEKFLQLYLNKVVNVHASLLPRWRGAAPIQRSLMAGDSITGVSLQVMVKKLDAGAVIGERQITVSQNIDAVELHDDLQALGADLLHIELLDYLRGNIKPIEQDLEKVTYAHKIEKSEGLIDWAKPAVAIHNQIRGMQLGPGTYTHFNEKKFKILKTEVKDIDQDYTPGLVVSESDSELVVACGEKAINVLVIQPESRSRIEIKEFLKGHPIKKGEIFGK